MSVETRHGKPDPRLDGASPCGPEGRRIPAEQTRPGPGLPLEIAFLVAYGVPARLLLIAGAAAVELGVTPDQALLGAGFPEDTFYRLLARHLGAPYLDDPVRLKLSPADLPLAQRAGIAPLVPNPRGLVYVLAPRGKALSLLLHRIGPGLGRRDISIVSPRCLAALVRQHDRDHLLYQATQALGGWDASLSAKAGLSTGQKLAAVALVLYAAAGLADSLRGTLFVGLGLFGLLFSAAVLQTLCALASSRKPRPGPDIPIADHALPVYTVVVPLYKEAGIVPDLVAGLDALDYPKSKLDLKMMVEIDDADTIAALERCNLPACYEIIVLPAGRPRTKPRALNYGLCAARGELLTVYDAEDRPHPRQLRDAVAAFARRPSAVACLQAQLAVDHLTETWLTRMFGLEYAALFDVIKPGLAALNLPVPLGGTSNHFRTAALRRVGAWDAWNVTEDIDLGFRLARFGLRVETLWSTTYEEAPLTLGRWLPQRSRWLKGWMVTLGVHTRQPTRLFRELGLWPGLSVAVSLLGTILSCLLGPVFIALVTMQAVTGSLFRPTTTTDVVLSVASLYLLVLGIACTVLPIVVGLRRRARLDLLLWIVTVPAYLGLVSLAAWRALFELVREPFGWNKTMHGVARRRRPLLTAPRPGRWRLIWRGVIGQGLYGDAKASSLTEDLNAEIRKVKA